MARRLIRVDYLIDGTVDKHEFTADAVAVTIKEGGRTRVKLTGGRYTDDRGDTYLIRHALYARVESILILDESPII